MIILVTEPEERTAALLETVVKGEGQGGHFMEFGVG